MTTLSPVQPDYGASATGIFANASATALLQQFEAMKAMVEKLDQAYVGAVILHLLKRCPQAQSFTINLNAESCSDDMGNYFRSVSGYVGDVETADSDEDSVDAEATLDSLLENLDLSALYNGISNDPDGYDDIDFTVKRAGLQDLIESDAPAGLLVHDRVFNASPASSPLQISMN